jgi:hypothetical protein
MGDELAISGSKKPPILVSLWYHIVVNVDVLILLDVFKILCQRPKTSSIVVFKLHSFHDELYYYVKYSNIEYKELIIEK